MVRKSTSGLRTWWFMRQHSPNRQVLVQGRCLVSIPISVQLTSTRIPLDKGCLMGVEPTTS